MISCDICSSRRLYEQHRRFGAHHNRWKFTGLLGDNRRVHTKQSKGLKGSRDLQIRFSDYIRWRWSEDSFMKRLLQLHFLHFWSNLVRSCAEKDSNVTFVHFLSWFCVLLLKSKQKLTCGLDRVTVLVVVWRRQRDVGARRAAVFNALKELRKPHPQAVVPKHQHTEKRHFSFEGTENSSKSWQ